VQPTFNVSSTNFKQESNEVIITSITKGSFSVGFQGGKDVLDLILSLIIPWRKAHAKEIARLKEEKMKLDQEKLRAETRQIDAQTNETNARAAKERQEACKIFLENSQLQQALENGLAAKMAEEIHGPEWHNLPEDEKLEKIKLLLPSATVMMKSKLLLSLG
jgi:hypothetical protein